jgi:hypothetical protein
MKKIALILIAGLLLTIAGCTNSIPAQTETNPTEEPSPTTEITDPTEEPEPATEPIPTEGTDDLPATYAPEQFVTVDEFKAFIQKEGTARGENFFVPRASLEGYELAVITNSEDGYVNIGYNKTNFVYDNKFSEGENHLRATAGYVISFFDKEWNDNRVEQLIDWDFKPLNIGGREVYYWAEYSWVTRTDILLAHRFDFVEDNRRFLVILPASAVDGLAPQEMGRYLEMVKVEG